MAVPQPSPDAAALAACSKLHAALPEKVDEGKRLRTQPESDLTAVWQVSGPNGAGGSEKKSSDSDNKLVLRCGVAGPPVGPTSQLREINEVEWFSPDVAVTEKHVYTTFGRVANLELTIPPGRAPAGALVDLADVVKQTLPKRPDAPSGTTVEPTPTESPSGSLPG